MLYVPHLYACPSAWIESVLTCCVFRRGLRGWKRSFQASGGGEDRWWLGLWSGQIHLIHYTIHASSCDCERSEEGEPPPHLVFIWVTSRASYLPPPSIADGVAMMPLRLHQNHGMGKQPTIAAVKTVSTGERGREGGKGHLMNWYWLTSS